MKHFGLAKADQLQLLTSKRTRIRGQKIIDHGIMDHGFSGGSFLLRRLVRLPRAGRVVLPEHGQLLRVESSSGLDRRTSTDEVILTAYLAGSRVRSEEDI